MLRPGLHDLPRVLRRWWQEWRLDIGLHLAQTWWLWRSILQDSSSRPFSSAGLCTHAGIYDHLDVLVKAHVSTVNVFCCPAG